MKPLIVALDVEPNESKKIVKELSAHIEIFKVGSRLFTSMGPQIVEWIQKFHRKVFLDLKFHDIPQTVLESCKAAVRMKVWALTVHTSGGFAMMKEAVRATQKESKRLHCPKPFIFGVTVLTSLQDKELKEVGVSQPTLLQVKQLALLAQKSGLDGVIASGNEIRVIREVCGNEFLIGVPGIRLVGKEREDQKRIVTPETAYKLGANYLIVGRPILNSQDPVATTKEILNVFSTYKQTS